MAARARALPGIGPLESRPLAVSLLQVQRTLGNRRAQALLGSRVAAVGLRTAPGAAPVQRQAGLAMELGVSPDDLRDSERGEEPSPEEDRPLEPGSVVQRSAGGRTGIIQRTTEETARLCPPYAGFSSANSLESYNCSGLAHRTYTWMNLAPTLTALSSGSAVPCGDHCAEGRVKHWLWRYDLWFENGTGTRLTAPIRDFHTVAGVSRRGGAEPDDVHSKNGKRPVYGPGTGPSFRSPTRERATLSHPSETPIVDRSGNPVFKARGSFSEDCFCLACPSRDAPLEGPPPPPSPAPPAIL